MSEPRRTLVERLLQEAMINDVKTYGPLRSDGLPCDDPQPPDATWEDMARTSAVCREAADVIELLLSRLAPLPAPPVVTGDGCAEQE
jgi:hypothetical protein